MATAPVSVVIWWARTPRDLELTLGTLLMQSPPPAEVRLVLPPELIGERRAVLSLRDWPWRSEEDPCPAHEGPQAARHRGLRLASSPWVLPLEEGDRLGLDALAVALLDAPPTSRGVIGLSTGHLTPAGEFQATCAPGARLAPARGCALHARASLPTEAPGAGWLTPGALRFAAAREGEVTSSARLLLERRDDPWLEAVAQDPTGAGQELERALEWLPAQGLSRAEVEVVESALRAALAERLEHERAAAAQALRGAAAVLQRGGPVDRTVGALLGRLCSPPRR